MTVVGMVIIYFNSIKCVLETIPIVTVRVVEKMHNEIMVTVESNEMTSDL